MIADWPGDKGFRKSPAVEVARTEEVPPWNKLPDGEEQRALFTGGSCRIVGTSRWWKAAPGSPTR